MAEEKPDGMSAPYSSARRGGLGDGGGVIGSVLIKSRETRVMISFQEAMEISLISPSRKGSSFVENLGSYGGFKLNSTPAH